MLGSRFKLLHRLDELLEQGSHLPVGHLSWSSADGITTGWVLVGHWLWLRNRRDSHLRTLVGLELERGGDSSVETGGCLLLDAKREVGVVDLGKIGI